MAIKDILQAIGDAASGLAAIASAPANTALVFWPQGKLAVLPSDELQGTEHVLGFVQSSR